MNRFLFRVENFANVPLDLSVGSKGNAANISSCWFGVPEDESFAEKYVDWIKFLARIENECDAPTPAEPLVDKAERSIDV